MLSRFFIDRPIFAWVVAHDHHAVRRASRFTRLPISRYPNIAPPAVTISASYPGASAQTVEDSVTQIIEQNMTALDGLLYMTSTSDNNGNVIDPADLRQRHQSGHRAGAGAEQAAAGRAATAADRAAAGHLASARANSNFLIAVGFVSEDGRMSAGDIGDYLATNVVDPMSRVPGVGSVQLFGSKYAMRIWLDPGKLNTYGLTANDVITAIKAQNAQVSVGQLGDLPSVPGQQINATVTALGRHADARAVQQHRAAQQCRRLDACA